MQDLPPNHVKQKQVKKHKQLKTKHITRVELMEAKTEMPGKTLSGLRYLHRTHLNGRGLFVPVLHRELGDRRDAHDMGQRHWMNLLMNQIILLLSIMISSLLIIFALQKKASLLEPRRTTRRVRSTTQLLRSVHLLLFYVTFCRQTVLFRVLN